MPQDRQRNQLVGLGQRDAAHAHRGAAREHAHVGDGEADALAAGGGQQHVVVLGADLHVDDRLALAPSFMAMMPERRTSTKSDSLLRRTVPLVVANITSSSAQVAILLRQRHDGGDALALLQRQDVDQRLAARIRRRHRQPPDLFLVDLAARGEEQHRRMGGRHEQPGDKILVAGLHAGAALAAAALRAIGRQRHALDVAGMRDRHDHVLALDQVFVLDLVFLLDDHGLARGGELILHLGEFGLDDGLHAGARAQDVEIIGDLDRELVEFLGDFVAAQRGQALQAQIENGLRLLHRQPAVPSSLRRCRGSSISVIMRLDVPGRPVALHQACRARCSDRAKCGSRE